MGVTTFGTTAEADEIVAMVRKVHTYVVGTTPDGQPYEANDPHLMLWVHHALVDSFLQHLPAVRHRPAHQRRG